MESNRARGIFQQLLTLLRGLTYRLYSLYVQIEDIKSELEVYCAISLLLCIMYSLRWYLSWQLTNYSLTSRAPRAQWCQVLSPVRVVLIHVPKGVH
jgi:hypothetical protein